MATSHNEASELCNEIKEIMMVSPKNINNTIVTFVVDSTSSMGDGFKGCLNTITIIGSLLNMMNIKFEIILYGDYDDDSYGMPNGPWDKKKHTRSRHKPVEVIEHDDLNIMIRLLRTYRIGQNGNGVDFAEACASAGYVLNERVRLRKVVNKSSKEIVFWLTDAPPHGIDDISYHFWDPDRNKWIVTKGELDGSAGRRERRILSGLGLATDFGDVMSMLSESDVSVNVITTHVRVEDFHVPETNMIYVPELTERELRTSYNAKYDRRWNRYIPSYDEFVSHNQHRVKNKLTTEDTMNGLLIMMNYILVGGQLPPGTEMPVGMKLPEGMQFDNDGEYVFPVTNLRNYYDQFVEQVKHHPVIIMYAPFLAGPYFEAVRKLKLTGEHGVLCTYLKDNGISQSVIDWFKEQAAPKLHLKDLNYECIKKNTGKFANFALTKKKGISFVNFLSIITFVQWSEGPECIKVLKDILQGLQIIDLNSKEFEQLNGDEYIMLSAVAEDPTLLCSFITFIEDENTMKKFTSLNTIVVAAVLHWCSESTPQLLEIMQDFIKRPSFMAWTWKNINVPNSIFNLPTLSFIRQALSSHDTTANKEVLDRIMRVLRVSHTFRNTIPKIKSYVTLETMKMREKALGAPGVYQVICMITGKPFPINIFVLIDECEFNQIRTKMQNYITVQKKSGVNVFESNKMFKKFGNMKTWDNYMNRLCDMLRKFNGYLLVSTYAKFFGDNCRTGLPYMDGNGVMDSFYWDTMIDKGVFTNCYNPKEYDSMEAYYFQHIGFNSDDIMDNSMGHGSKLINANNIISKNKIHEGGCVMVSCTKRNRSGKGFCGAIYMVTDSTSGAVRAEAACASCRNQCQLYNAMCKDCGCKLAMGIPITPIGAVVKQETMQDVDVDGMERVAVEHHFGKENCVFCNITSEIRGHNDVQMVQLANNNIELFSGYFGIPEDILQRLVSTGSPAKALREKHQNREDKDIIDDILHELIHDGSNWVKTLKDLNGLNYQGPLTEDTIDIITDMISKNFKLDCILCETNVRTINTTVCHDCGFCFCNGCAHSMYSDQAWFNQKQNYANYSCPACRSPIKKGYARKNRYRILYQAIINGDVKNALTTPKHDMITCGNPECKANHRTCVIELGDCEVADTDVNDTVTDIKDDDEPKYLECIECKTDRIDKKNAKIRHEHALQEIPGVIMPNGLIISEDGIILRACSSCGLYGSRNGACWKQYCICGHNYPWCCGKCDQGEDVYAHIHRCTGGYSGSGFRDGGRHNPDLHLPDGTDDLSVEQKAAVEIALNRGGNLANRDGFPLHGDDHDDDDDDDDDDDEYNAYYNHAHY